MSVFDITLRSIGLEDNLVYFTLFPWSVAPFCGATRSRRLVDEWMTERDMHGYSFLDTHVVCDNPDDAFLLFMGWS